MWKEKYYYGETNLLMFNLLLSFKTFHDFNLFVTGVH